MNVVSPQLHIDRIINWNQLRFHPAYNQAATMRVVLRRLSAVKPAQYLEAGAPTGLTGLPTHPSPRSTLVYLYSSTLDKLRQMPESSVYRQSTEALTQHRLKIVEGITPAGYKEWQENISSQIADDPEGFVTEETSSGTRVKPAVNDVIDARLKRSEWDGETGRSIPEGIRDWKTRFNITKDTQRFNVQRKHKNVKLVREPPLTADQ